ncbi:MAG: SH3 domain-containing protein [Candidatus Eisenbacteria bacterium]|uniref:SH3 domain-containing protein n=1 Tax=Eiseniibacteriota bacterium TaxID=2212470 RepID=A0A538TJW3_UNCEI|nr:MAG: SH3 domain-containing protein [Candidatus Eisenbacteria bacterium]
MIRFSSQARFLAPLLLAFSLAATNSPALAKDEEGPQIPTCDKKIGTMSVLEPETKWWLAYNLESPEALIKVYANECKCFTLLDRGKGLAAAEKERALASGGEMRVGSNVGKGQMKAADYVLVPDIVNKNANSGGKHFGAALGGLVGHGVGAVVGGVNLKSKTADVVLTLTDVRSTEQVAIVQGHAKKTNVGWGAGGGGYFGAFAAAGASSYANTEIGQVVAMAYLDAFKKLIEEVQKNTPDAKAANVSQSVTMAKPGRLYEKADNKSKVVRELDAGTMLYPTGEKDGIWWKVSDELGNEGWVPSPLFNLAK